jgi:hypothetical protein
MQPSNDPHLMNVVVTSATRSTSRILKAKLSSSGLGLRGCGTLRVFWPAIASVLFHDASQKHKEEHVS